jgi:uncharacterized protein
MVLPDVNVLVYAHREDTADHDRYRGWLEDLANSPGAFGLSDLALSGFLRIVTHPRVFKEPSRPEAALAFVSEIRSRPNRVRISPGPRHWDIFTDLVRKVGARGNLIPDAYFAALAIESGCEWVTTDRDYARFRGLRWRHPLEDRGR